MTISDALNELGFGDTPEKTNGPADPFGQQGPTEGGATDLDLLFWASVLREGIGAWIAARHRGLTPEHLEGPGRPIVAFITDYVEEYKALPDTEVVEARFGVIFPDTTSPADFFVGQVLERRLAKDLLKITSDVLALVEKGEPTKAYELYREGNKTLAIVGPREAIVPLGLAAQQALDSYDLVKSGVRGLMTPWPTINDATLGIWPQDLWVLVARQGVGKTTLVNLLALAAWLAQKRVLFVTTEMSNLSLARRLLAMVLKFDARQIRGGCLPEYEESQLRDYVQALKDKDIGFYFTGGRFTANPAAIEAACMELEPDLLIADGPYLFRMGGKDRMDNTARAFDFLKGLVKGSKTACLANMQFNRAGAKEVAIENVGLTDAAGWNADYMAAAHATPDDIRDRILRITGLKQREGELHRPFSIRWDWRTMDFSEIHEGTEGETYDPGLEPLPASTPTEEPLF